MSPPSPFGDPKSATAPLSPELVARLRKCTRRILWQVCAEYADDGEALAGFTDDELLRVVGDFLLRRHVQFIKEGTHP